MKAIIDSPSNKRTHHRWLPATLAALGLLTLTSCGRDARLADDKVREVPVSAVSAYGRTLDQDATPREVVYVLLKAVVDDYDAGYDTKKREEAFDIELATSAPQTIKQRYRRRQPTETELTEYLYKVVRHWAPVLGYYVDDFRVDYETLSDRMTVQPDRRNPEESVVYLNVSPPDSEKDPNAGAVARFHMTREAGYWRISWVGWETSTRKWGSSRRQAPKASAPVRRPTPPREQS